MAYGRKPVINPCERKGRAYDTHSGVSYQFKKSKIHLKGCCECAVSLLNMAQRDGTRRSYSLNPDPKAKPELIYQDAAKPFSTSAIKVAPCQQFYRKPASPGLAHHQARKPKSKFAGCQALEEELYENRLIVLTTAERNLEKFLDYLISTGKELVTDEDGKLELATISAEELVLLREQAEADPGHARGFWRKLGLTKKQRAVIEDLFLYYQGETMREIAKKHGITLDSLKDRIHGAKQKLRKEFPELMDTFNKQKRKPKSAQVAGPSQHLPIKKEQGKESERCGQVFQIDPLAGEKRKLPKSELKRLREAPKTPISNLKEKISLWEKTQYNPTCNGTWSYDPAEEFRMRFSAVETRSRPFAERNPPQLPPALIRERRLMELQRPEAFGSSS